MEYEHKTLSDDELKHWGILGMKWGVRRYQNKDGTLTAKGKKRYTEEMNKIKAEKKKLRAQERDKKKLDKLRAEKEELERMKKKVEEKPDESDEAKRERIMKTPTAKDVYENRHLFSGKELSELHQRLNTEENIKKLVPKEIDEGKARADKAFETIGDLTNKAITASKAYNAFATIYNAFNSTDSVDLPRIDIDNINKANQETRRQQKKRLKDEAERQRVAAEKEKERAKAAKEAEKQRAKAEKEAEKQAKKDEKERKTAEKKAAAEQAKQERLAKARKEIERQVSPSASNRMVNRTVSQKPGRRPVKNWLSDEVSFDRPASTVSQKTASSGKSFVGRYDRTTIADLDRED